MSRLNRFATVAAVAIAAAVLVVSPVGATGAEDGATLTGKITFSGTVPEPTITQVPAETDICGETQASQSLVVGDGNGVQWAVVSVIGAGGEVPPADAAPTFDQNGCTFTPHVAVVGAGQPLDVLNSDGILHNVHTHSEANPVMNMAQPGFRKKMTVQFENAEIFEVVCDVHSWMSGWIVVTDSPYVTVTDANGSFTIPGLPAGTYEVKVWHETLGVSTQEVTLTEGVASEVALEMTLN